MNKFWIVALIVVVAFAGLFLVTPLGGNVGTFMQSGFGGVTPLSISKASLVQDSQLGQAWFVSVSTLPNAFSLTGRISASDVADKTGKTPLTDFDININARQSAKFLVHDSGVVVYDYSIVASNPYVCIYPFCSGVPNCPSNAFTGKSIFVGAGRNMDFCVYRFIHGKFGTVSAQASFPTQVDISVLAGGKLSNSVTLDTASSTSLPLSVNGKVLGRVDYAGDLVNSALSRPEIFQTYTPINKDGIWYFTSASVVTQYNSLNMGGDINSVKNTFDSCILTKSSNSDWSSSTANSYVQQCVTPYHNTYLNLQSQSISGLSEIKVDNNSQLFTTFTLDRLYSFPVLTFVLDTDWVGFKLNKGIPSVQSATASGCTSGSGGSVTASVKNIGDSGAFDVKLSCKSPVSVETPVQSEDFNAGEIKSFDFNFDMNVDATTSASCTVTATDKGSFVSSAKTVAVSCNPAVICTANQVICQDNKIQKCQADGSGFVTQETCPSGCGLVSGVVKCSGVCTNGEILCVDDLKQVCNDNAFTPLSPAQSCSPPNCSAKFFGLVKGDVGVIGKCNFWCSVGLSKPVTTTTCVYDWTPVILIGGFLLILTAILVFGLRKSGKKSSAKSSSKVAKVLKSKTFWKFFLAIAIIMLIIIFFKYIFWISIGFVILFLVDLIFMRGLIRKGIMKLFKR